MEYYQNWYPITHGCVFALSTLYIGISTALFWKRRHTPYFAGRSMLWNVLQAVGGYTIMTSICFGMIYWVMPCFIQLWLSNVGGVMWCAALTNKAIKFHYEFKINQAKLFGAGSASHLANTTMFGVEDTLLSTTLGIPGPSASASASGSPENIRRRSVTGSGKDTEMKDTVKRLQNDYFWINRHRASDRWLSRIFVLWSTAIFVPLVIVMFFTKTFSIWPTPVSSPGCFADWEYYPSWAIWAGYQVIGCPILWWKVRSARDNHGLRNELILISCVTGPLWIFSFLWEVMLGKLFAYKEFPPSYWYLLAMLISHTVSVVLPVVRSYREEWKREKMVLKHNMGSFMEVLSDRSVWEEFKLFVAADMCVENALFYEAYQELIVLAASSCMRANLIVPGFPTQALSLAQSSLAISCAQQPHQHIRQYFHRRLPALFQSLLPQRRRPSGVPLSSGNQTPPPAASPAEKDQSPMIKGYISSRSSSTGNAAAKQSISPSITSTPLTSAITPFLALPIPPAVSPHYRAFYETYLKPGAPYEVNIPSSVREEAEKALRENTMTVGMFEDALGQVVQNMFFNSFASFLDHTRQNDTLKKSKAAIPSSKSSESVLPSDQQQVGEEPVPMVRSSSVLGMTEP